MQTLQVLIGNVCGMAIVSDTWQFIWDLLESSSISSFVLLSSKLTNREKVEGLGVLSKTSNLGDLWKRGHGIMGEEERNILNLLFAIA